MDIDVQPGRYVVAVSGGVDSVALLHMLAILARHPGYGLTVAHFDHGIRPDSHLDRQHVQRLAAEYGLPFVYARAELGPDASEAAARQARYDFLHSIRQVTDARAIITAHHQGDLLETAVLNLLRGTGRRGLSSLGSTDVIKRPLLHVPKEELLRYATEQGLQWREDSTNADEKYLRNYVRINILPRFADNDREAFLSMVRRARELNEAIELEVTNFLHVQPGVNALDRYAFIMLPHAVAREVMASWLRLRTGTELSRGMVERLVRAAKTGRTGSRADIDADYWMEIGRRQLSITPRVPWSNLGPSMYTV